MELFSQCSLPQAPSPWGREPMVATDTMGDCAALRALGVQTGTHRCIKSAPLALPELWLSDQFPEASQPKWT